jgi:hypothetical protein
MHALTKFDIDVPKLTCERFEIPSTKQMESKMLLFPVPFNPVIALNWGSKPEMTVLFA